MNLRWLALLLLIAAPVDLLQGQNFPDRVVSYDPLGDHRSDTVAFDWLGSSDIHLELARYSNGSGSSHRWNAKAGGFVDLLRWDSTWSVAAVATTEIVIDPNNSVAFNPRSIFWEEGLLVSRRISGNLVVQLGGMQRCKHDIDNLELSFNTGRQDERTLIYSGATLRLLLRPTTIIPGIDFLRGGFALRNEYYVHILDHRIPGDANLAGDHLDRVINTTVLIARLELRRSGQRIGGHISGSLMMNLLGGKIHEAGRFDDLSLTAAAPFLELGIDLINPMGTTLTLFARGEWQRDAAILPAPHRGNLVLFGARFADLRTTW